MSISCVLAAVGFVVGGFAILLGQAWWQPLAIASAALSTGIFVFSWDRGRRDLDGKGIFAVLIGVAILVAVVGFGWPDFGS